MNKILLISALAVFGIAANAADTTLRISNLYFQSDFERRAFEEYDSTNLQKIIQLAFAGNSGDSAAAMRAYNSFENFLATFRTPAFAELKLEKKIKTITKTSHSRYFKMYKTDACFADIFGQGDYNCVSGSIVYGMILQDRHIPFEGKLNPTHVFIVANPKTNPILLEATDPMKGYIVFNNDFKNQYVEHLKNSKLISNEEYTKFGKDQLFQKYYFEQSVLSLTKLIGVEYYNKGLSQLNALQYREAFRSFFKAAYLFPEHKNYYHALISGAMFISAASYRDPQVIDDLMNLLTIRQYGITDNQIEGEFQRITNELLNTYGLTARYDSAYERISSSLPDGELKQNISFYYNFSRARNLALKGYYTEAFEYSARAYQMQLNNADAENLFLTILEQSGSGISTDEELVEKFIRILTEYPGLLKNRQVKMLQLAMYLHKASVAVSSKSDAQMMENLKTFEESLADFRIEYPFNKMVEDTYYSAVVYLYKKGKKADALALHAHAESLLPNSFEIKRLKQAIK